MPSGATPKAGQVDKTKRKAAKITAADEIRARIRARMSFLHTNQDAIDKKCGFGHGFLNDFLVGRKHSMNADAMAKLIDALETTRDYLLLGKGAAGATGAPAERIDSPVHRRAPDAEGFFSSNSGQIERVSDLFRLEISIDSLDLATGDIVFRATGDAIRRRGIVLDPNVFLANSGYAQAFTRREAAAVYCKDVTFRDGSIFLAALHVGQWKH